MKTITVSEMSAADRSRVLAAADRLEIMELGARFDNGLDAEMPEKFVGTFVAEGALAGFWGEAAGFDQIRGAYDFMLSTFARNRRHVVTNHEIGISGDTATMFSYLTVFDRASNTTIGTATFTDQLVRHEGAWRFKRRTLAADSNVQSIIDRLTGKS